MEERLLAAQFKYNMMARQDEEKRKDKENPTAKDDCVFEEDGDELSQNTMLGTI
jgi:hypothetical protein